MDYVYCNNPYVLDECAVFYKQRISLDHFLSINIMA